MTNGPSIPLVLLPGMGADQRMFAPQLERFANIVVPTWIAPRQNESLSDYARRFARAVDPGGPCWIGGSSFGGFLAVEMSRHLQARACFLIASLRSPHELPIWFGALEDFARLANVIPFGLIDRMRSMSGGLWLSAAMRSVSQQLGDADPRFLRWACQAVLGWRRCHRAHNIPIHHVHGDRDKALPLRFTRPDCIIRGGGHLISLTHPNEVNQFLTRCMAG